MQCTYDEFDAKCNDMELMFKNFPTAPYFPSDENISQMILNAEKYYDFIVYLTTNNPIPSTSEESRSMKLLNDFIRDYTNFVEDEEMEDLDSKSETEDVVSD